MLTPHEPLALAEVALAVGELGVASGQTVIIALLPVLIREYSRSNFWIGFAVGGEGIFALVLPFIAGLVTDALPARIANRVGRHSFLLLAATPVMMGALVLLPFASSYWPMTMLAFAYFAAHHMYETPLISLVADALPDEKRARVGGARSVFHAIGLAYGLVGAGLLFSIWKPLPFIVGGALVAPTTMITAWAEHRVAANQRNFPANEGHEVRAALPQIKQLLGELKRKPAALWLLVANALWDGAVDGIRPYFFVFAMVVVGVTIATASLGLIALVLGIVVGSAVFGKLGDKYDRVQLLRVGALVGIAAMSAGFFVRTPETALVVLVAAGIGAAAMMTLPYPLFATMVGKHDTGKYAGVFVVSISLGRVGAPMFVGGAIDIGARFMPATKGYPMMWPAAAVFAILAWLALGHTKASVEHT